MTAVYFDRDDDDDVRRQRLFGGDLYVYSPRRSSRVLCQFARELAECAFAPHVSPLVGCESRALKTLSSAESSGSEELIEPSDEERTELSAEPARFHWLAVLLESYVICQTLVSRDDVSRARRDQIRRSRSASAVAANAGSGVCRGGQTL